MSLLTPANVRARIPGLEAGDDARLQLIIDGAEAVIAAWLWPGGSQLEQYTHTDTLDGPDTVYRDKLWLSRRPVVTGTVTVTEDGTTLAASDYSIDLAAGALYREDDSYWTCSRRYNVVAYDVGWVSGSQPDALTEAILLTVERLWRLGHVQGLPNASDEDGPEDRTVPPTEALALVGQWRSWGAQ